MIRVAVLTVSDGVAAGTREDVSGRTAVDWIDRQGWSLVEHRVAPDERAVVTRMLTEWSDTTDVDLILTLGGTGFGPRDITPEATSSVIERRAPGIAEALRASGASKMPHAMLGRGLSGIRGRTLIVNLPGSKRAVREGLELLERVVPHAVDLLHGRTEHSGN
ncbi:MAG: MogA/MoaB family molybdenum cofactor biosynthesis protein [Gemmatimonadetes bacterium]|uniref:Molybdopterin adenylyltransferase n=1 Tax=Candidatus Kutchimonas denitrificans TaxID=3056748 RepID=A0AAE4Z788_9BACT|nr:MogA/MoaB family molybdenum cofactor biosynthesis protein [Gemmatimonadota bacterium]NIR73747.1 MogA/MoaB family molybdenum cofactor biosynthesis protein [Candidatus Kutchimonas denitrificans]NIS03111.1 MogA/MoaB family molybdenum cofactor biosynthesis protein [Gemmatimonadota bacterium]NIT69012.1 MogA/MoaB family molybdenum cofactor biosynthesis protein [Gemmatimonadota bacterium]NIU54103.1 molybdenum cofactor biosynthesis protein [Gemmatimonadota bacterium]